MEEAYGKELILDIHDCDPKKFTRSNIENFYIALCEQIEMIPESHFWWDYDSEGELAAAPPHLAGTSGIQFIRTSNITIHTLNKLRRVYLNIFSCKLFDRDIAGDVCLEYFGGRIIHILEIPRI